MAGKVYSPHTLQLVFEFVNLSNDIKSDNVLSVDNVGDETIQFLKNTRKIARRISGVHPSSLGLHPAVYFYSVAGRYQPTSFFAIVELIKEFERRNYYRTFTEHRRDFEEFILHHKEFANQVAGVIGSGTKGMKHLQLLYQMVLDGLAEGNTEDKILQALFSERKFSSFLKLDPLLEKVEYERDFDSETKSTAFLHEALKNALRCQICQGFIHTKSISIDHSVRKEDGGIGSPDNAQLTHPYCNTTYKN